MVKKTDNKLIDYDLTVRDFFTSARLFLLGERQKAKDIPQYMAIEENIKTVMAIAANPRLYSDYGTRVANGLEPSFEGFAKRSKDGVIVDNRAYLSFVSVLNAIDKFYNADGVNKEKNLLDAIKRWKYTISNSLFKDFTFPFKSAESFASRVSIEKMKQR